LLKPLKDCETVAELAETVGRRLEAIKMHCECESDIVASELNEIVEGVNALLAKFQELERCHDALCRRVDRLQGLE
jgi:hypothetical protein